MKNSIKDSMDQFCVVEINSIVNFLLYGLTLQEPTTISIKLSKHDKAH